VSATRLPFSPYLTLRHGSHINVEVVVSNRSPQYLCKYFTKGGSIDRGMVGVKHPSGDSSTVGAQPGSSGGDGGDDDGPVDEIAERQDTRIVGAHSALMALRGVPEVALTPPCESLDLHLENDQTIYGDLATGAGRAAALRRVSKSRLEGFFRGNSDPGLVTRGRHASHVPYELWPSYFIWSQEKGVWSPRRQRGRAKVGRIRWAHPSDGDIFYLRRLLMSPHWAVCAVRLMRAVLPSPARPKAPYAPRSACRIRRPPPELRNPGGGHLLLLLIREWDKDDAAHGRDEPGSPPLGSLKKRRRKEEKRIERRRRKALTVFWGAGHHWCGTHRMRMGGRPPHRGRMV
jgi:hypothetical protein